MHTAYIVCVGVKGVQVVLGSARVLEVSNITTKEANRLRIDLNRMDTDMAVRVSMR